MAIRVENAGVLSFGTIENETMTHWQVEDDSTGTTVITKAFANALVITAVQAVEVPIGDLDLVYENNEGTDAWLREVLNGEFARSYTVRLLTDATTEVDADGYVAAQTDNWTVTVE